MTSKCLGNFPITFIQYRYLLEKLEQYYKCWILVSSFLNLAYRFDEWINSFVKLIIFLLQRTTVSAVYLDNSCLPDPILKPNLSHLFQLSLSAIMTIFANDNKTWTNMFSFIWNTSCKSGIEQVNLLVRGVHWKVKHT